MAVTFLCYTPEARIAGTAVHGTAEHAASEHRVGFALMANVSRSGSSTWRYVPRHNACMAVTFLCYTPEARIAGTAVHGTAEHAASEHRVGFALMANVSKSGSSTWRYVPRHNACMAVTLLLYAGSADCRYGSTHGHQINKRPYRGFSVRQYSRLKHLF